MSRIGRLPIPIPEGVKVNIDDSSVKIEGPKGCLAHQVPGGIDVSLVENKVLVSVKSMQKKSAALHGLTRSLLANMITGVSKGFEQIDNAVLETLITIDKTVPITVNVRIDDETSLQLVGKHKVTTNAITIDLGGDAGVLLGDRGSLELPNRSSFKVKMNVGDSVVVDVPIQLEIPIKIPLSDLDLGEVVVEMKKANAKIQSAVVATPQPATGGGAQE